MIDDGQGGRGADRVRVSRTDTVTPGELVDAYFAAVNAEDWDRLGTVFHPECVLRSVGSPPRQGPAEIVAHLQKVLAGFARHHDAPTRVVTADSTVLVEIHYTGETTTGAPVEFDAVDVFDVADAKIHRLSTWYDTAAVGRQVRGR